MTFPNRFRANIIPGSPHADGPNFPGTSGPVDKDITFRNQSGAWPGMLKPENRSWYKSGNWVSTWTQRAVDPANNVFAERFGFVGVQANTCPARCMWGSPIFDLRPDLGASMGSDPTEAYPLPRGGAYGAGGGVTVFVRPLDPLVTNIRALSENLDVYSLEGGHPMNPQQVLTIKQRQQISEDFFVGNEAVALKWYTPHSTLRFWRMWVIFDWLDAVNDPPQLELYAVAS